MTVTYTSGTTTTDRLGAGLNPFRYRGYYFDSETGFYYLNSRYYNPNWGRFFSPDVLSVITATPNGLKNKNFYAYCDNNPILRRDDGGKIWNLIIGAGVGLLVGGLVSAVTQLIADPTSWKTAEFWGHVGVAAVSGAVTGLVAATGVGLAGQIAWNAGVGIVSSIADTTIDIDSSTNLKTYVNNAVIGGTLGAIGGFLGGAGTATKHMQSAWKTVLKNGNWSYYLSQVTTEAIRAGKKSIYGILKSTIPTITRALGKEFNDYVNNEY